MVINFKIWTTALFLMINFQSVKCSIKLKTKNDTTAACTQGPSITHKDDHFAQTKKKCIKIGWKMKKS